MNFKKFDNDYYVNLSDEQPIPQTDFIDKLAYEQAKQLDNAYCKFLEENGYKIDKPYNINQLREIKEDLAKQDKFLDHLQYTEFSEDGLKAYYSVIPFFNSLSNPLSEENRQEIIEKWKENNRKD